MQAKNKVPEIRVEVGKRYVTRCGLPTGIVEHNPRVWYYHFRATVESNDKPRAWDGFGRCSVHMETPWDIVAEHVETPEEAIAHAIGILSAVAASATPLDKVPATATSERAMIGRYLETVAHGVVVDGMDATGRFLANVALADQPADDDKPSAARAWADLAEPGYSALAGILQEAHDHAAKGKGKERHANGQPFRDQPIMAIPRSQGTPAGQVYQVQKKSGEALGMYSRGRDEAAVAELLGVINYAAAAILHIRETH